MHHSIGLTVIGTESQTALGRGPCYKTEKIFHTTFTNAKRMRVVNESICVLRRLQLILSRSMCEYRRDLDW
jgi:hypothetical protein